MRGFLVAVVCGALLGCIADSADESSTPSDLFGACDPLGATSEPLSLGEILGVGRDAGGTLYVLDRDGAGMLRVFVSEGDVLARKNVAGTGEGNDAGVWYVATVSDPPFVMKVETTPERTRIGILLGECNCKSFNVGDVGDELTVMSPDVLAGLAVENLAGDVTAEYWGTVDGQHRILITRATYDWQGDVRLFFGPPDAISERLVDEFSRARDGGTTYVTFDWDGAIAQAYFPSPLAGPTETPHVTVGDSEFPIALDSTAPGAENSFYCLRGLEH